jgi:integrase
MCLTNLKEPLKPAHFQKYYADKMKTGVSTTTIRHHHMFLHRVVQQAVIWQLLNRNPADADLLTLPKVQHTEMHTYDEDGIDIFLEEAMNTPYYSLFHTALYTGMRRSELLALRWSDVDFIGAEISISRSLHRLHTSKEIVYRGTKTKKSARTISFVPENYLVLRKHLDNEMALCTRLGIPFNNDRLVFCHWDGQPYFPDTVSQSWYRINKDLVKSGKLTHRIRLHDARHSHASLLLKAGIPAKVVQERLGHSSIATTMDLYSHVAPNMQKEAAKAFGDMLQARRISRGLAEGSYVKPENTDKEGN